MKSSAVDSIFAGTSHSFFLTGSATAPAISSSRSSAIYIFLFLFFLISFPSFTSASFPEKVSH